MNGISLLLASLLIIGTGVGTGYFMAKNKPAGNTANKATTEMIKTQTEAGTTDTSTFKDYATGDLTEGGINGEGTHHLVRPGGASQTVYLISSLVDLSQFVGKKVEVYGQTVKAKSAGWLMDVGRIKVIQ
jgi:hypothetical protein